MSWSKTQGEIHEETLTWSVDSLVKVNKKQTAWAALVVHEENIDVDFEVNLPFLIHHAASHASINITDTYVVYLFSKIDNLCTVNHIELQLMST